MRRLPVVIFFFLISSISYCQQEKAAREKTKQKNENDPAAVLPVLIRGPYLQNAAPASVMIRWRTDALSRGRVQYGKDPNRLDKWVDDSSLVTEHKVVVKSLEPYTRYYYSVGEIKEKLQGDSNNYFYTLPPEGSSGSFRIAALGDCGNNSVNQRNTRDQLIRYLGSNYLNAWMLLGDNAYPDCTDAEFQTNFFNVYKNSLLKKYPLFPCPGNHDYHDVEFSSEVAQQTRGVAYYQNFSMPVDGESGGVPSHSAAYYSFNIGNIHFLSLDSYGEDNNTRLSDTLGPQAQWVKKDLENAAGSKWIIACWHHPPFTMGSHNSDTEQELIDIREHFIPILERYGVDLVLCGHSHDYERSRLMNGYYGAEKDFDSARYVLSGSSGKNDGSANSAPYLKKGIHAKGTIYVVTGSAGKLGGMQTSFPHAAMYYSDATHGGLSLLEITGDRLDFKWICADGIIRDRFTIVKKTTD
jgi:acid phosphatase type 7